MKKLSLVIAMAAAIAVVPSAAEAATFSYSFTGNDGVFASGTLIGNPDASIAHAIDITSGTITLHGAPACTNCGALSGPMDGDGVFALNPGTGVFYTGGGTQLILAGTDSLLYPFTDPIIDSTGILLFQMNSGLGVALFSNEPGGPGYGMFGGNWTINDSGDLNVSPEPGSLVLLSTGLFGLAGVLRRRLRS